jgi:hypothetical protein
MQAKLNLHMRQGRRNRRRSYVAGRCVRCIPYCLSEHNFGQGISQITDRWDIAKINVTIPNGILEPMI